MSEQTGRKLVITQFLSLDGVMEDPGWTMPYWEEGIAKFKYEELKATEVLLYGRVTYEMMAAAWPTEEHKTAMRGMFSCLPAPWDFSARMNEMRKYVVSKKLKEASWSNSAVIRKDVLEELKALKAEQGGDILVLGSGALSRALMKAGLVDELQLTIYPVQLGKGMRFFADGQQANYELISAQPLTSRVVQLAYRPISNAGQD